MIIKSGTRLPRLLGHFWRHDNQASQAGLTGLYLQQRWHASHNQFSSTVRSSSEIPRSASPLVWSSLSSSRSAILRELSRSPSKQDQALLSKPRIPLVVILLSSSHASLLDNAGKIISSHLQAVFPKLTTDRHIDILAAVVDSIPPGPSHRPQHPRCDGLEGVCVAYLDSDVATPDLWSHRQTSTERDTMTIQQRCSLTFSIQNTETPHVVRKIQLPVANTLFLNGKPSTLIAQRWIQQSDEAIKSHRFELMEQRSLPEQTIDITVVPPAGLHMTQTLPNYLNPITRPRTVAACVGNIVQQVGSSDGSKAVPASQELEQTIQQRIQDGRMPKHSPDVWALITPKGTPTCHDKVSLALLQKGCQLHKVLSGGGGWGVKQGLLSLDPDSRYKSALQEFDQESLPIFESDSRDEMHIFGNVVQPGDTITFLVNEIDNRFRSMKAASLLDNDSNPAAESNARPFLHFGTIPSTMDMDIAIQSSSSSEDTKIIDHTEKTQAEAEKSIKVPNFFGALSETGMSFERSNDAGKTAKVATKLDAPYMAFKVWFQRR